MEPYKLTNSQVITELVDLQLLLLQNTFYHFCKTNTQMEFCRIEGKMEKTHAVMGFLYVHSCLYSLYIKILDKCTLTIALCTICALMMKSVRFYFYECFPQEVKDQKLCE